RGPARRIPRPGSRCLRADPSCESSYGPPPHRGLPVCRLALDCLASETKVVRDEVGVHYLAPPKRKTLCLFFWTPPTSKRSNAFIGWGSFGASRPIQRSF